MLPFDPVIEGLNDSKQVKPRLAERIAAEVKRVAVAWTVGTWRPPTSTHAA
ncbi:MAG: hypothetical protein ACLSVD_18760 [Eggerthellaceae bacterium]